VSEIHALIVDDEPPARRGIRQLLNSHPDVRVIAECRDGREALLTLDHLSIDLVFLDIQMPGLDGFEVVRTHGPERMPPVIFVTAYDQFAVRAFETRALDYLVKPLNRRRFDLAISRVRERRELLGACDQVRRLTGLLASAAGRSPPVTRLAVPRDGNVTILPVDAIDWIEAVDYLARIHAGNERHLLRESLASLMRRLDQAQFMRIHRSAVVRIDCVRELRVDTNGEMSVVLSNCTQLPVSRRRRASARAILTARGAIDTAR
jgi:two-component system, LytTR family, response regulator